MKTIKIELTGKELEAMVTINDGAGSIMTTTQLVTKMLWESGEVKTSIGGHPYFRSIMNFLEGKTLDFSELTGRDDGRIRKHAEIAQMIEDNFSIEIINRVKEIYTTK